MGINLRRISLGFFFQFSALFSFFDLIFILAFCFGYTFIYHTEIFTLLHRYLVLLVYVQHFYRGRFYTRGRIIHLNELGQTFVVRLGYASRFLDSVKTSTRRIIRLDELPFEVRRSRRISTESSSRRIMRLVLVFILLK